MTGLPWQATRRAVSHLFVALRVNEHVFIGLPAMEYVTKATSEGIDPAVQSRLAEMEGRKPPADTIPIPLNDDFLTRQTWLELPKKHIIELKVRLSELEAKAFKVTHLAAGIIKAGAKWADDSAHDQLGAYPWAKLAGAVATVVGTRMIRLLPFGSPFRRRSPGDLAGQGEKRARLQTADVGERLAMMNFV